MYDAVIIGAGPVGSRAAFELAEKGHRIAVLEKKADLREPVCCTGIVSAECVREFGIPGDVIFREANSASIYSPSGKILHVKREETQAYIIDRAALNVYLAGQAMKKGAEYFLERRVHNIEKKPDRVVIETGDGKSKKKLLEARAAIIAAGFGSVLTEQAGLKKVGDFAMGVQAEVETAGIDEVEVYTGRSIAPGFFAWLVPTVPGRALVGLISRSRTNYYMTKLLSALTGQGKIRPGEPNIRFAGVALNTLTRTSTDRILAAGSAAGQVKPATGGGVYYGMMCADIAADNLHRALESDNLTAEGLASYDRQWKQTLGREIKLGHWGRKFFERLSDDRIENIFDIILSSGIDKTLLENNDIRFDSHGFVILKLIGHEALIKTLKAMKIPFPSGKRN